MSDTESSSEGYPHLIDWVSELNTFVFIETQYTQTNNKWTCTMELLGFYVESNQYRKKKDAKQNAARKMVKLLEMEKTKQMYQTIW